MVFHIFEGISLFSFLVGWLHITAEVYQPLCHHPSRINAQGAFRWLSLASV